MKNDREFEKKSIMVFFMMMLTNICNYLFQVSMGKALEVSEYAVLNTLLSLSTIIGVLAVIITTVTTRYTAYYFANRQNENISLLIRKILMASALAACVIVLLSIPASKLFGSALKINETMLIIIAATVASTGLVTAPLTGTLQGLKRFGLYTMMSFIPSLIKLGLGLVFVYVGMRIYGAMFAFVLGNIFAGVFGAFCLKDILIKSPLLSSPETKVDYSSVLDYLSGAFLVQLFMTLIVNGDMILVKVFFSEYQAGLYASTMVIGKISMHVAGALVAVLLPMTAEQIALGKDTRPLLNKALIYGGGISVVCVILLILLIQPIVSFLFGSRYLESIPLLVPVSAYVVPLTFLTILMNYTLALGRSRAMALSLGVAFAGCVSLAALFHSRLDYLMYMMGGLLAMTVLINYWNIRRVTRKS